MRPTVIRRISDSADAKERARRVATILAAGLERLLGGSGQKTSAADETALDSRENQSVTTDCLADGSAQEPDDLGD